MIGILACTIGTILLNAQLLRRLLANDSITSLIGCFDAEKKNLKKNYITNNIKTNINQIIIT